MVCSVVSSTPLSAVTVAAPLASAREACTSPRASSPRPSYSSPVMWSPASLSSQRSTEQAAAFGRSVVTQVIPSSPPHSPPAPAPQVYGKAPSVTTDVTFTSAPITYTAPLAVALGGNSDFAMAEMTRKSMPITYTMPPATALGGSSQAPVTYVAPSVLAVPHQIASSRVLSRPLAEFEFEKLQARTSAAQTVLANLEEDIQKLRSECKSNNEKQSQLEQALEESMPTGEHYEILRAMSREHLVAARDWERREIDARSRHRTRFEETMQSLQASLTEKEAQLKEFDQAGSELQRASAGQRVYEERSARYADQVQQLASLHNIASDRQAQVDAIQYQAVDIWKQLQAKLWEVDDLRAECEAWKLQWHTVAAAGRGPALFSPRATSPARQLFLAHLGAADQVTSKDSKQANYNTSSPGQQSRASRCASTGRTTSVVSFEMADDDEKDDVVVSIPTPIIPVPSSLQNDQATVLERLRATSVNGSSDTVVTQWPTSSSTVITPVVTNIARSAGSIARASLGSSQSFQSLTPAMSTASRDDTLHASLSAVAAAIAPPAAQTRLESGEVVKSLATTSAPIASTATIVAVPPIRSARSRVTLA